MPPKASKNARAVREFTFWTADAEGNATISKWLAKALKKDRLPFFASFTNWCSKQAQRVSNAQTNWKTEELKERSENLLAMLRTQPLDVNAYIWHMKKYLKHDFTSGFVTGRIKDPGSAGVFEIMQGQDRALEMVFTRIERENMMMAGGEGHKLSNRAMRRARSRTNGDAEEAARVAAAAEVAEENKSSLGAWDATKNAVGEVEEQIAVDQTTKAFGQTEISQRQPWEDELADRTK